MGRPFNRQALQTSGFAQANYIYFFNNFMELITTPLTVDCRI